MRVFVALSVMSVSMFVTSAAQARSQQAQALSNIKLSIKATWYRQTVMHLPLTRSSGSYKHSNSLPYVKWVEHHWKAINWHVLQEYQHPPHLNQFMCIHRYEGSWSDTGAPFWGGLQMDAGFQRHYAPRMLTKKGTADVWTPLEQIWTAEHALKTRGFGPWPNTARYCGLL